MTLRQIAALRFITLALVALVLMLNLDMNSKDSVDRADVVNASALQADAEAQGAWCWTGSSDLVPNAVIVTKVKTGEIVMSSSQRVIDRAIEQTVFGKERGLVVHVFCQTR